MNRFILSVLGLLSVFSAFSQESVNRDFQLGLVTPLGTNGVESYSTTNKVSVNILGGQSSGNTCFEFGGLYNVNKNYTKGFQFAGLMNYSGCGEHASQFAGITNIMPKGTSPFQFAGIANVADEADGLQFAGIANVADKVNGLQFAGIVNVAREVNGVQFGLINVAEECDGVSVGLINVVKKDGKHEFELSFSESLNTAVSFKLGTDKFYTIFSGAVNYIYNPVEYAAGIGFGTHINWKNDWSNQIEIIGYGVTDGGCFDYDGVNMLAQLKLPISKQISKHFKVFAGPVFNVSISDCADNDLVHGAANLSPWKMWNFSSGKTQVNGWIGLVAGVRF